VANVKPKMIVHDIGPQKITLSPPIEILGSPEPKNEIKSIFNPIAKGKSPSTVVIAVNNTGRKRVLPPDIIKGITSFKGNYSLPLPDRFNSASLRSVINLV